MKKHRYQWIISNNPLCDNPTTLVSQSSRPVTFVFSIYYGFLSKSWIEGQHYLAGWRFSCNIWFSNIASCEGRSGRTTVCLSPSFDERGYLYFDSDHAVRANNPRYATEEQCIEAAIEHVAARLDTTLLRYPDIVYYLVRPEFDFFFSLYQALCDKKQWLDEVRHPKKFVGLGPQLQLF
ncbi:hypothetical protein BN8_p06755 (plasmid) [Fibrisoma limi BUZ 3]|uniref:Uncharacterized protein n=1 Tax=Fibrisoma limi BUZ 3 TaxID=1185876 RepID=I2GTW8_9BACT|nr:hypothetical protein [Fibrisoma limi]CCH57569.1 hypothetical protein BN8_p06755 [Fibrisoma limi BUZ 3]